MRLFTACRRGSGLRKHFLKIVLLVLVYLLYHRFSNRKMRDSPNLFYNEIDLSVNTSSYLKELTKYEVARQAARRLEGEDKYATRMKRVIKGGRSRSSLSKREYLMVAFTKIFDIQRFCDPDETRTAALYVEQCPYKNCIITCDRTRARLADLVLFHAYDLAKEDTETKVYLKRFLAQQDSRKDQIWLLWHDEVKYTLTL